MAQSTKHDRYSQSDDGRFECIVCKRRLASKQRVLLHLHRIHDLTPVKREKKKYMDDTTATVPRSTLYRWKKRRSEVVAKKSLIFAQMSSSSVEDISCVDDPALPAEDVVHEHAARSWDCQSLSHVDVDGCQQKLEKEDDQSPKYDDHFNSHSQASGVDILNVVANSPSTHYTECQHSPDNSLKDIFVTADPSGTNEREHILESSSCEYDCNDESSCDSFSTSPSITLDSDDECESSACSDSTEYVSSNFSCSENESDCAADIQIDSSAHQPDIPEKEYQALSLLSCFLRNQFSASASKDVVETLRKTFTNSVEISQLDLGDMLSYVDAATVQEIHYCIQCNTIFPDDRDAFHCQTTRCDGLRYKGSLTSQRNKSRQPHQSFVFADVEKQLVDLLLTPGIWQDIQETKQAAFERLESGSAVITDIMDGAAYRAMMTDGGFLDKGKHNLTAVFNTDGVNLYSSSKVELWPIFLAVNELSPPKRFSRDNVLLVGIWQGRGKPPFSAFFKIFSEKMNSLYNDGIQVLINGESYRVNLSVVCGIADLPAKAELLNMTYFNGQYACIKCEEPGMTVQQGKGTARCYPYNMEGARSVNRSLESVFQHMRAGTPTSRSKGFKGISGLMYLENFDLVSGMVPDYMHGVLLGITKRLMCKWFSPSESKKDYFVGKHIKEISERMKNLKPPDSIERLPRDLEKHYQHFKATELQSWLLYYAYPCMQGFLQEKYLENLMLLSEGIHILLRDFITEDLFVKARNLLDSFYESFQKLYGDGSCGLNVHNVGGHLCDYVKSWGPIWCWSCFPFEDANAMLLQTVHGTGLVLNQVMKYRQAHSCIRKKGLDLKKKNTWKVTHIATNCEVAGAAKPLKLNDLETHVKQQIEHIVENSASQLKKVYRVIVNGRKFYSEQYSRMQRRICNAVLYGHCDTGLIKYFILSNNIVYAVIEKMEMVTSEIQGVQVVDYHHYTNVRHTKVLTVRDVSELKEVLVYLSTCTDRNHVKKQYVVRIPNAYGHAVFK